MGNHLNEVQVLLEEDPKGLDAIIDALGISFSSPEAYYVEVVYTWMTLKKLGEKQSERNQSRRS